jgi:hypothetical protein
VAADRATRPWGTGKRRELRERVASGLDALDAESAAEPGG